MNPPIIGTIVVTRQAPGQVVAQVDGQRRVFPSLADLFRAAVRLAEERTSAPNTRKRDRP